MALKPLLHEGSSLWLPMTFPEQAMIRPTQIESSMAYLRRRGARKISPFRSCDLPSLLRPPEKGKIGSFRSFDLLSTSLPPSTNQLPQPADTEIRQPPNKSKKIKKNKKSKYKFLFKQNAGFLFFRFVFFYILCHNE